MMDWNIIVAMYIFMILTNVCTAAKLLDLKQQTSGLVTATL